MRGMSGIVYHLLYQCRAAISNWIISGAEEAYPFSLINRGARRSGPALCALGNAHAPQGFYVANLNDTTKLSGLSGLD